MLPNKVNFSLKLSRPYTLYNPRKCMFLEYILKDESTSKVTFSIIFLGKKEHLLNAYEYLIETARKKREGGKAKRRNKRLFRKDP